MEQPPKPHRLKRTFFVLERIPTPKGDAWQMIPLEEALWAIEEDSFARMLAEPSALTKAEALAEGGQPSLQAPQQQKAVTLPEKGEVPLTED